MNYATATQEKAYASEYSPTKQAINAALGLKLGAPGHPVERAVERIDEQVRELRELAARLNGNADRLYGTPPEAGAQCGANREFHGDGLVGALLYRCDDLADAVGLVADAVCRNER